MHSRTQEQLRQDRSALEAALREAGAEIRGNAYRCPFHDDKHASGSIYCGDDGAWRCKCNAASCGVGGDMFDIRARVSGRPLADVLRDADPGTAKVQSQRGKQTTQAPRIHKTIGDMRLVVAKWGEIEGEYLYQNPDTGKTDLLVFRYLPPGDEKKFIQCHPVPGGWDMHAPEKPWPLYRRKEIRDAIDIVVVEGEKKADALNAIGIPATTAPCGAGKAKHADLSPLAGKRIWLWPDNDSNNTGRLHMRDVQVLADRLDPAPTIRVIEPNDLDLGNKEDAFDFIQKCKAAGIDPRQAVLDAMAQAKSLSLSSGLRERIEATIDGTWVDVPLPWPQLSRLSRALLPQTVTVLCGTPGAAKSLMVMRCLVEWFEGGIPVACLALEEDRTYHLQRVLAIRERNIDLLDPEFVREHPDIARGAYERHQGFLDRFGKRLWDAPVEAMTLPQIASWVRDRAREGCRVIVVDPVTAAVAEDKAWVSDTYFVNDVKAIVRAHDASLLLVTHPKKGSKFVGLDDLAGGAVYQRLAQCVLWVERHSSPKTVTVLSDVGRFETQINETVHICKARNGRGHGMSLGFKINWPTLEFAEQGVIVKGETSE